jgi:hypothetical protein
MKNYYSFLYTLLCLTTLVSQERKSFELTGIVLSDSLTIKNVHVLNNTSLKGTFTNSSGVFILPVKIGDTLILSHINFNNKRIIISIVEKITKKISVSANSKTHTLNEISLKKRKGIFYVDPQIILQSNVNNATFKFPYANIKAKPENKNVLRVESGLAINLVSLIQAFNGKRKKIKELKNAKIRDQKFDNLRNQFQDSFFLCIFKNKKRMYQSVFRILY